MVAHSTSTTTSPWETGEVVEFWVLEGKRGITLGNRKAVEFWVIEGNDYFRFSPSTFPMATRRSGLAMALTITMGIALLEISTSMMKILMTNLKPS